MPRTYAFDWLDVFARSPLEGNQLAVFPDAHGISEEEMPAIARETHLSETTFVFPEGPEVDAAKGYRTRIFAVAGEMPFAGHPTLGTAAVLAQRSGRSEVALRLRVGTIPVRFSDRDGHRYGEMTQNEPTLGQEHERGAVARALGVPLSDLDPNAPVRTVSTGVPFAIVPFRSPAALAAARPSWTTMERYLADTDARFFYLLARKPDAPDRSYDARMIFSGGEDPATGSAAGPAGAWAVLYGGAESGRTMVIEQGREVRRPSRIFVTAELADRTPNRIRVGGHVTPIIRGELTL